MTTEEENKPFVGTRNNISSVEELKEFLADIKQEQDYYFVRSPHKVSGIKSELLEEIDSAREGQVFNSQWELRWKTKGSTYELLLLSNKQIDLCHKFKEIKINWKTEDRKALLYESNQIQDKEIRSKETRFPKGFTHNKPKVCQRYFSNSQTATVHFVALTVRAE